MGTNYYLHKNKVEPCPTCGRCDSKKPTHIGKSSYGWMFALHVGFDNIMSLEDWVKEFEKPDNVIKDEYGRVITKEEMIRIITQRNPTNIELIRHNDKFCVGHGPGTWDLIIGDFS